MNQDEISAAVDMAGSMVKRKSKTPPDDGWPYQSSFSKDAYTRVLLLALSIADFGALFERNPNVPDENIGTKSYICPNPDGQKDRK